MNNEYTCQLCKQTFEKGITDEEAMEESKEIFGDLPKDELELVCGDCFKKMNKKFEWIKDEKLSDFENFMENAIKYEKQFGPINLKEILSSKEYLIAEKNEWRKLFLRAIQDMQKLRKQMNEMQNEMNCAHGDFDGDYWGCEKGHSPVNFYCQKCLDWELG